MAESLKDLNAVINVGGVLTHWNGASEEGGELTEYDTTPVGGPPAADYDADVRKQEIQHHNQSDGRRYRCAPNLY